MSAPPLDLQELLTRAGVALVLGSLVGLERQARLEAGAAFAARQPVEEHDPAPATPDEDQLAGVRTFAVLALLGMLASCWASPWVFPAALLAVGGLLLAGYVKSAEGEDRDLGSTTVFAALVVFLVGGLCGEGHTVFAASAASALAFLLSAKERLHRFASRLRRADIHAVVKFAALSAIVLPLLPTEPLVLGDFLGDGAPQGWWLELNLDLRKVWWLVILVSLISFVGYFASKILGSERGLFWTGALGGLASSTAVCLANAKQSREAPGLSRELTVSLLMANLVLPPRFLLLVGIFAFPLVGWAAIPAGLMALAAGVAVLLYRGQGGDAEVSVDEPPLSNPFSVGPALKFGALFAAVLVASQVSQALFGDAGTYALSFLAGLTDVDAISLTLANQYKKEGLDAWAALTGLSLVLLANTLLKAGLVLALGSAELRRKAWAPFAAMLGAAGLGLALIRVLAATVG